MSTDDPPFVSQRDEPTTEVLFFEGLSVSISRQHCIDAMGPDEDGFCEFHYDYERFEFFLDRTTLHGRAYADEPTKAHLLGLEVDGSRALLTTADLQSTLARGAVHYFRSLGRTDLSWLDKSNEIRGYSPIP